MGLTTVADNYSVDDTDNAVLPGISNLRITVRNECKAEYPLQLVLEEVPAPASEGAFPSCSAAAVT